jgi:chemotaxis signal transduction protein
MTTLVFFRCGDGRYAVPVHSTLGVRPPVGLVPLPRPAPGVVGLLPGDPPITVVSVLGRDATGGRGHVLLLTDGTRRGGLLVDAVTQVARVPTATLAGSPGGQALELIEGVVSVGGQMVLLADVGALLGETDRLAGPTRLAKAAENDAEADDLVAVQADLAAQRGMT